MTETNNTVKGFAYGEHTVLRPVVEDDLRELARLMAENPYDGVPVPWTHQRLKKKFEDKDNPGLWGQSARVFAVLRKSSGLVGYLREREDSNRGVFWNYFHIAEELPDRAGLGVDVLSAYLGFKRDWHNPLRISFDVVRPEEDKAAWLRDTGFELELTQERKVLHLGQPEAVCTYTWFSAELKQSPGWDDPATAD